MDISQKKEKLSAWFAEYRIPGKAQGWFEAKEQQDPGDFRWMGRFEETPFTGELPDVLKRCAAQLEKEHLQVMRKGLTQIIFRSLGDGRYACLMQGHFPNTQASHAYKTWQEFLRRFCPEVVACHQVETRPAGPFDPSQPPEHMHFQLRAGFGSEYLEIAGSGLYAHCLDWMPKRKDLWLRFPERLRQLIHPRPGDRLLQCHAASGFEAFSLAEDFSEIHLMDAREWAQRSFEQNVSALRATPVRARLALPLFQSHKSVLDASWVQNFFAPKERYGRWTVLLNPPRGELLGAAVTHALAEGRPERIVLVTSHLANAATEVSRFRSVGYCVRKVLPMDTNPLSPRFGLCILFVPDRAGLLSRKAAQKTAKTVVKPQEQPQGRSPVGAPAVRTAKKIRFVQR